MILQKEVEENYAQQIFANDHFGAAKKVRGGAVCLSGQAGEV